MAKIGKNGIFKKKFLFDIFNWPGLKKKNPEAARSHA